MQVSSFFVYNFRANRLEKELKDGPGAERTWYQNKTAAPKKKPNPADAKPKMSNKKQVHHFKILPFKQSISNRVGI